MSAIKNADRIVFIHQGQIVEDGTHSELMALNGHYYEMVKCEMEKDNETQIDNNFYQMADEKTNYSPESFKFFKQKFPEAAKVEDQVKPEDTVAFWESFKRIPRLLKSDWIIVTIAVCSSIILGFTTAIYSVIFAEIYGVSTRNVETSKIILLIQNYINLFRYCQFAAKMKQ